MYRTKVISVSQNPEYVDRKTGEKTGSTNIVIVDDNGKVYTQFIKGIIEVKANDIVDFKVCSYYDKATNRASIYLAFASVVKG